MPNSSAEGGLPSSLVVARRGDIAILRLSRPDKRNALNDETVRGLWRFFSDLPEDLKGVVLCGAGQHFSSGLDLSEVVDHDVVRGISQSRFWHRTFDEIQFAKVPVIAVLHGAVIGGGLELACAAHLRVAEASAYYGLPEGQRGIFVGGGGAVRLPRLIGVANMMDLMLTGRTYSADEGQRLGISQYQVADGDGLAKGLELANKIAGNATLTNFAVIQALPRIAEADPASGLLAEALMAAIAQGESEAKNRLRDFLEKRAGKVVSA